MTFSADKALNLKKKKKTQQTFIPSRSDILNFFIYNVLSLAVISSSVVFDTQQFSSILHAIFRSMLVWPAESEGITNRWGFWFDSATVKFFSIRILTVKYLYIKFIQAQVLAYCL